jgi:DNA polymerase-3 subunit delta
MIYKSYVVENNIKIIKENFVLLYGENLGLKDDLKSKIKYELNDFQTSNFDQEDILKNEQLFFNEINNLSLFEKKKIFFINQVNDKSLELLKETILSNNTSKFYLFSNILEKKSKIRNYFEKSENCAVVACYGDNEISIKKIILNRLQSFEGLTPHNINLIIDNSNLDRIKLNNELNKIVTYFQNKIIETNKLEILLDIKLNDNFNLLKDEALNGNKSKTNKLLGDTIIDAEKYIFYLTLINQRLNKIHEVTSLTKSLNIEEAISSLKPPIFWKDKPNFLIQIRKWNLNKIKTILDKTYNLEIEIKSNAIINKNILMKKLLVDICELANVT